MKLSANKVSQYLDISTVTLANWYKFYNSDIDKPKDMPELPAYEQLHPRGPKYWKQEDLPKLKAFQDWIPKGRGGVMGLYNARYWGARGKRALKNKEQSLENE